MFKNILKLKDVQIIEKDDQKLVNGSMLTASKPSHGACSVLCADPTYGGLCGPIHCPYLCTGNGDWVGPV